MKESAISFHGVRGKVVGETGSEIGGAPVAGEYWKDSSSVINCETQGHCYHPGTAVGSLYCCKCNYHIYPQYRSDCKLMYRGEE